MKEVLAIIRPNKVKETKKALLDADIPGFTGRQVRGRGREAVTVVLPDNSIMKTDLMTKREIIIVVNDEDVDKAVETIMSVNNTGNQGDGKIFVSPITKTYTISNGGE